MRNLCLFTILFLSTWNAFALEVNATIYDIIEPEKTETTYLILTKDGLVYEIDENETDTINLAFDALKLNVEIIMLLGDHTLNEILGIREKISSIKLLSVNKFEKMSEDNFEKRIEPPHPLDNYQVSVVKNYSTANELFKTQKKRSRRKSQCYSRAHVWSYELSDRINTGKVFLFFTRKYIREFRYKWWFHVSPYTKVLGESEEIVLDRKFLTAPLRLTDWKNRFIANHAPCPSVQRYSDYRKNQFSNYCYFIKTSMYYWQPYNIENLERRSPARTKTKWINSELRRAYRDGFKRRDRRLNPL